MAPAAASTAISTRPGFLRSGRASATGSEAIATGAAGAAGAASSPGAGAALGPAAVGSGPYPTSDDDRRAGEANGAATGSGTGPLPSAAAAGRGSAVRGDGG